MNQRHEIRELMFSVSC